MKKKKILALLLAATMIIGSFAGCSSKKAATDNNAPTEATDITEGGASDTNTSAESGGKITLAMWNQPNKDDAKNVYAQCEKALGIDLDITVIPESDYSSKLNQMVSTGDDSVDIYVVWENDIKNFAQAGGIIQMDDYLKSSSIKTDDFVDAVTTLSDGLGGTYGLPWGAAAEILYYNQDMFDAAGISYPTNDWSYTDFMAAAEKLTQKAKDGTTSVYGCTLPNTQTWWAGIGSAGDKIYDASNGQMTIGDGAASFVSDCADMVKKGIMPAPSSDTTDLFASGKAAMSWQGSWMIGGYGDTLGFNWDISCLPVNKVKYNTLHTGFYTINAKSKNKELAFKAIEYLMSEKAQNISSDSSGCPSAIKSIAAQGAWKVSAAKSVENWDALTDAMNTGAFGYVCLPSGVTNNAISEFNAAVLKQKTPQEAVESASQYAKETIGY